MTDRRRLLLRSLHDDARAISTVGIVAILILVLAVLVFVAIDFAYVIALAVILIGGLIAVFVPERKAGLAVGGVIIVVGVLYALYITSQGALALSLVPGVP